MIDKPKGWTSFDVVNKIRFSVAKERDKKPKNVKVGHAGTLDPLATGLLIVLVGKEFTKKASEYSKMDKTYEVTMKLGQTSVTGDEEGEKTEISERKPSVDEVQQVIDKFCGEIMQTPHSFSAIKVNGQRAYKLARKGQEVVIEPRKVTIYSIELTDYTYPLVSFTASVSSGTYIRSLVEAIGKELKTGAYMSDLRRTEIGDFSIEDSTSIDQNIDKKPDLVHHKVQ